MRLPVGKLPHSVLSRLLSRMPIEHRRVILGPGIGCDCAVIDAGERLQVYKSDPITFATDEIGYYLVQVNANDIATTGAKPLWLLVTLLLPERSTTPELAATIADQIGASCRELGVTVIGGHTEVSAGLERPIAIGTMIGEVSRDRLVTPRGARPGDRVLLTKGAPIEATALLAREFAQALRTVLSTEELQTAQNYLRDPGIGVSRDAELALGAGHVSAMHDPTEGGVVTALWELAQACGHSVRIDPGRIHVPELAQRVCDAFAVDPLCAIASGALLITVSAQGANATREILARAGIACTEIGEVIAGPPVLQRWSGAGYENWPCPSTDAVAALFAGNAGD
jgi:hydrogenase maturation factor